MRRVYLHCYITLGDREQRDVLEQCLTDEKGILHCYITWGNREQRGVLEQCLTDENGILHCYITWEDREQRGALEQCLTDEKGISHCHITWEDREGFTTMSDVSYNLEIKKRVDYTITLLGTQKRRVYYCCITGEQR